MFAFIATKLLRSAITMVVVVTAVFVVLRLTGDPIISLLPLDTPADILDQYRERWGLNDPIWLQYVRYWVAIFNGDLGRSIFSGQDAVKIVFERLPHTLLLGGVAFVISLVAGIGFGTLAALNRGSMIDRGVMAFAVTAYSLPNYFLGILLILLFALELRWMPAAGAETWKHLVMPAFTLGMSSAGVIARFVRSAMLEVIRQPYMRTAAAKGASVSRRIAWHALPNAAIPTVTVLGFQLGFLIGGSVVVESVFAWPGAGRLLVTSVGLRDFAVVQTMVFLVSATVIFANFMVDVAYGWLDPRVTVTGKQS